MQISTDVAHMPAQRSLHLQVTLDIGYVYLSICTILYPAVTANIVTAQRCLDTLYIQVATDGVDCHSANFIQFCATADGVDLQARNIGDRKLAANAFPGEQRRHARCSQVAANGGYLSNC